MKKYFLYFFALLSLNAFAYEKDPALLSLGSGVFNIVKYPKRALFQAEYIFSQGYYKTYPFTIRPMVGLMMNVNASTFLYGGVRFDLFASRHFVITPSFAPGLYLKGQGKNLHFPLEFRSAMETAYVFTNKARLGAQFYHISNASLGSKNPGVEALVFFYALPL